jgi:hypothetical protein
MLDIMGMLPYLRLRNAMQPQGISGEENDPADIPYDAGQRMNDLYHPSTTMQDRYSSELNNRPDPNNFQPSKFQRIFGGMAALTNPEVGEHIIRGPYEHAMADFNTNTKQLHDAADLEYRNNTNSRILANDTISREEGDRRNDISLRESKRKSKKDEVTQQQNEEKIQIQRDRAQAYEWSKTHPNYDGRIDKDGKLVYVNKTNPSDIVHTNIDTGKMNDFEKIQANIKGRLEEIGLQGKNASELEDKRQTNRIGSIDEKARLTPPKSSGKTTTTTIDPSGKSKTVISTNLPNPDSTTTNKGVTPGNNPPNNMNIDEMVSVINPQGNRVKIKKSQLNDALKSGYKQVQ